MTDKVADAQANRDAARRRGICPVIPHRRNAKNRPRFSPKCLYRGRARIEQTIGKLKRFKRIALRCEKTAENFAALIACACGLILAKSVHTASMRGARAQLLHRRGAGSAASVARLFRRAAPAPTEPSRPGAAGPCRWIRDSDGS
jgi:hypothetical protein